MRILILLIMLLTSSSVVMPKVSPFDLESFKCHLDNLYHEIRGDTEEGIEAVMAVVNNRSRQSGKTVCQVIYQPYQFSWTTKRPVVREKAVYAALAMRLATRLARGASAGASGGGRHVTGNAGQVAKEILLATHYHAYYVKPAWASKMKRLGRVGAHIFYRKES